MRSSIVPCVWLGTLRPGRRIWGVQVELECSTACAIARNEAAARKKVDLTYSPTSPGAGACTCRMSSGDDLLTVILNESVTAEWYIAETSAALRKFVLNKYSYRYLRLSKWVYKPHWFTLR